MIRIKKSNFILKKEFDRPLSDEMSVFQNMDSLKNFYRSAVIHGVRTRTIPQFYYLYDNDECKMILPVMQSKNRVIMYGDSGACGMARLMPIIFNNSTLEEQRNYFSKLVMEIVSGGG